MKNIETARGLSRNEGYERSLVVDDVELDAKGSDGSLDLPFRVRQNGGISEKEINEAYAWHRLFNESWITAHELGRLSYEASAEKEGEAFKIETEKLRQIKTFIEADFSDGEFREQLASIRELLPRPFQEMVGMEQTQPHMGIDPVEHTFNMLERLDTEGLSIKDRQVARMVGVFHDVGKVYDAGAREHPKRSKEIAQDYLEKMGYDAEMKNRILVHIEWHDALGEIARRDGRNILEPRDVATYFPNEQELELHRRIVKADVASIPGLSKYLPNIEAVYKLMNDRLKAEGHLIDVHSVEQVPVQEVEEEELWSIVGDLWEEEYFDEIDVYEAMRHRNKKYQEYQKDNPEAADLIERAVVQYSLQGNGSALKALQLTGRETDRSIVSELEKKYNTKLDQLRLAVEMFSMTYHLWNTDNDVLRGGDDGPDVDIEPHLKDTILRQLKEIKKSAIFMSQYCVEATHVTNPAAKKEIDRVETLLKSDTGEAAHFEGDGVYTGILGSYKDWDEYRGYSESSQYALRIPLADTLPILVSYNYPKAMSNVLCEGLYVREHESISAVPHGLVQWRQSAFDYDVITGWKIEMLEELLGGEVQIVEDEEGKECVVMDTDEEPIVWGAILRALRIRRFIPKSELSKSALEYNEAAFEIYEQESDNEVTIKIPNQPYQYLDGQEQDVVNIRGVKGV